MSTNLVMLESTPSSEEIDFLEDRLYEHNAFQTRQDDGQLFAFFVRDEHKAVIAGISGWTWAGASEIRQLWVHPDWRGQGWGEKLLQAAEDKIRAAGCQVIFLSSYSFQAPGFYQKHGYELACTLDNFPPGHQYNFLIKRLAASE